MKKTKPENKKGKTMAKESEQRRESVSGKERQRKINRDGEKSGTRGEKGESGTGKRK